MCAGGHIYWCTYASYLNTCVRNLINKTPTLQYHRYEQMYLIRGGSGGLAGTVLAEPLFEF